MTVTFPHLHLCAQLAEKEAQRRSHPLRVKKLYVLAALLIEQYHQHMRSSHQEKTKKRRPEVTFCLLVIARLTLCFGNVRCKCAVKFVVISAFS